MKAPRPSPRHPVTNPQENELTRTDLWPDFLKAVQHEVVPALGCTEPISLALAAAIAARHLSGAPERIEARVSANLMKNGMGVTVPGTGMTGLPIAAAVGALGGDPDGGLEVLRKLSPEAVAAGKRMLSEKRVEVGIAAVPHILYAEARLSRGGDWARACIADAHTRVVLVEKNGEVLFKAEPDPAGARPEFSLAGVTARDVFDFAVAAPFGEIAFILDAARLNSRLAEAGMSGGYGLHIGATMRRNVDLGLLSDDLQARIVMRSAAASDARMGGATLPAMSNSGSGNQGITATLPVVVVAGHVQADDERLARALILSHLTAIYIHDKLPRLSALCAVTTAAMGAAAAMAWLLGGGFKSASMAICSMIGDLAGMICDGASNSCAMKVSTSVGAAYKAVLMALDDARVSGEEGIVADDVDQSIANLCALASGSMAHTDRQIIEIIMSKHC
ncbi:MAG: L-serine ammonia-lyase, iron-sulfur-dependent, subunit alpha [Candidatus Accumulibacter sp.]|jgi:L-cysteine desulfidase|nr:L-serine ammonia-lyase, iron-sulfur-dependent, subunit alpha [Accumulibacter sp.]